jgi:hypothetical protein
MRRVLKPRPFQAKFHGELCRNRLGEGNRDYDLDSYHTDGGGG